MLFFDRTEETFGTRLIYFAGAYLLFFFSSSFSLIESERDKSVHEDELTQKTLISLLVIILGSCVAHVHVFHFERFGVEEGFGLLILFGK